MTVCYRCQEFVHRRKRVTVKNGMVTTTYCKHCYKAVH